MRTYKEITSATGSKSIKRTDADGTEWWIPLDPANSDYAEYLRLTAWVDAENDPDEFWTQPSE
jgi:hypothetical protein